RARSARFCCLFTLISSSNSKQTKSRSDFVCFELLLERLRLAHEATRLLYLGRVYTLPREEHVERGLHGDHRVAAQSVPLHQLHAPRTRFYDTHDIAHGKPGLF